MAVPAAIVAIVFIDLGGLAFALFLIAIGCICLHELYRLLARWRPVSVVGFAALAGMVLAARYGSQRVVMEVAVGALPVLFLGDTAAYIGGRLFGRRPLAPQISPNKTVEGLFCGMLIAVLSIFFAGLYQDWLTQGDALLLGLAVAILGPLGDLFESVVKRDAGTKDAGRLFGPHGGALDRLDAVIFTIMAGYYIWVAAMH